MRERWNYRLTPEELGITAAERGNDTVGLVIRTTDGRFVAALSTGGTAVMLRGRVGDVPLYGAGLWASNSGAAAATGTGERITEVLLANTVCGWLRDGAASDPDPSSAADRAARRGVDLIAEKAETGLIVITPHSLGAYASAPMAWAGRHADEGWESGRDGTRPG